MPLPKDLSIIEKFNDCVFIETGTCNASSLRKIVNLKKYREHYSVEALKHSPVHNFDEVVVEFATYLNVHLTLDDSTNFLRALLPQLNESITFWLDAHYAGTAASSAYENPVPLLQELKIIQEHSSKSGINTHTIMIDDVRDFNIYGVTKNEVESLLREINPEYNIYYVDCKVAEKDVLIATVLKFEELE